MASRIETNMRKKKYLDKLVLKWGGNSGDTADTKRERDVLENLQPHTNLKKLEIQSYGGTRFPGWLEDLSCLSNLVRLHLWGCGNCLFLPPVEQLSSLQELVIQGFNGVVTVGSKPFPNLRKLSLFSCPEVTGTFDLANFPELETLRLEDVNVESLHSPNLVGFPDGGLDALKLTSLAVDSCSKLRSLPQHMHKLLPSLRRLFLSDCPELESFSAGKWPSKLEELYIYECKKLVGNRVQWGLPILTSLQSFNVSFRGCEEVVDSFPDEGLLLATLLGLYIYGVKKLDGKGFKELTSIIYLEIGISPELRCLPDEGLPASLSSLRIKKCALLVQRCQRETGEDWPKIAHVKTIEINGNHI